MHASTAAGYSVSHGEGGQTHLDVWCSQVYLFHACTQHVCVRITTLYLAWCRVWDKLKEAIEGFIAKGMIQPAMARAAFGLAECKLCITGAAPSNLEVLKYLKSVDIPVLELYGMSENTGPHSTNVPGAWKLGSVGKALPGVKTKIDQPDENGDGEVWYDLYYRVIGICVQS